MIVRLRKSIWASPFLTWFSIIGGRISLAKPAQTGHCRSPNSISVTGPFGSPRTIFCCGIPASRRSTSGFPPMFFASPPLPLELTTIRTRTTARARKAAPAAICSSRWRRSGSARTRSRPLLGPGVGDQPRGVEQEEDRHQDRAADAPLADRFDLEDLQIGEEDAVAEAAEGEDEAAEAGCVVSEEGAGQQQGVAGDSEDGDVDAREVRVGAPGDGRAAVGAGEADGRAAAGLNDRDVGGDPDAESRGEGDRPLQRPLAREALRLHREEDKASA